MDLYHPQCICIIFDIPHNFKHIPIEVSIHLIKSDPGLHTCQAWEPLVYLPGGLCHSS